MLRFNLTTINKAGWAFAILAIITTVTYTGPLTALKPALGPASDAFLVLAVFCWGYVHGARDEAKVGN